jgi:hypothetical protein
VAYYNWTFGGACGYGWYGNAGAPPYMADVYGFPVIDFYVDSVPPYPPQPRAVAATTSSVSFTWDPVADRGDGAGQDYWAVGMDHYTSWLTVAGGAPKQLADSAAPRILTAAGLAAGQQVCVHVRAFDALGNGTGDQQACAQPIGAPPSPPPPPAPRIGVNPIPTGLAGLDSWFWLTPAPSSVTVGEQAGGYTYEVTSTPTQVTWSFGDGGGETRAAPEAFGLAYPRASPVTHTYQAHSSAGYPVAATVHWQVTWRALSGGQWIGPYSMPGVDVASGPTSYLVRQAQTEVTGVS